MNLFYAVLAYVMVFYNCMQAIRDGGAMNGLLAAMWLAIGVFCTVKHLKAKKEHAKKNKAREDV